MGKQPALAGLMFVLGGMVFADLMFVLGGMVFAALRLVLGRLALASVLVVAVVVVFEDLLEEGILVLGLRRVGLRRVYIESRIRICGLKGLSKKVTNLEAYWANLMENKKSRILDVISCQGSQTALLDDVKDSFIYYVPPEHTSNYWDEPWS